MDYRMEAGIGLGAVGAGAESGGGAHDVGSAAERRAEREAHYMEFGAAPLAGYDTAGSLDDVPWWPKVERFDYDAARGASRACFAELRSLARGSRFSRSTASMRGLDTALMDLLEERITSMPALDRIEHIQTEMMRQFFARIGEASGPGFRERRHRGPAEPADIAAMWRRHLEPRMRRWCNLIHAHGLRVFYHTDGAARPVIGPLIDCGIDVLNPIQHVCAGMEAAELKREFGSRIVFHGGIDNQFALPRWTPDDVRRETRDCLETLGAGREATSAAPCHNAQAGTPVENIPRDCGDREGVVNGRSLMKSASLCLALVCAFPSELRPPAAGEANIVFIMADDLGYNDLSCQGATKLQTRASIASNGGHPIDGCTHTVWVCSSTAMAC